MMKIWFDLSNSPHINLFFDLIKELESDGNEVIITSRPLANTVQLLDQKGLKHTIIGTHYGKSFLKKIYGFPIRIIQLKKFIKSEGDVRLAVSQSSFHSPVSAWLLGIPSVYTNDNEHALGNMAAFLFASQILLPQHLKLKSRIVNLFFLNKIKRYPGIKEGIYLWRLSDKIYSLRKNNIHSKKKIYFRPEPQTAQYYKGKLNFLDNTITALQKDYQIVILPRNNDQLNYYKGEKFHSVKVLDNPIEFIQIAEDCMLFIGAGGSMTRELAVLGIPTISVYQDHLLEVDKVLIQNGLMIHEPELTPDKLIEYLNKTSANPIPKELLKNGKTAYNLIKQTIVNYQYD